MQPLSIREINFLDHLASPVGSGIGDDIWQQMSLSYRPQKAKRPVPLLGLLAALAALYVNTCGNS